MATSFESILEHTKITHPIRGGTYRYLPEESSAALKRELEETRQKLEDMRVKYAQLLKRTPTQQQPPAAAAATATHPEIQKLQASLASSEAARTVAEQRASDAKAKTESVEKKLNESVQQLQASLGSAEAARKKAEQRATEVEAEATSELKAFETEIMSMLDGISPRRMAAGGTSSFQEEAILSVLGSTADQNDSARIALEAMRETLKSVGKHEDLVKQWEQTLATH